MMKTTCNKRVHSRRKITQYILLPLLMLRIARDKLNSMLKKKLKTRKSTGVRVPTEKSSKELT
jgi:hypothetical protein